MKTFYLLAFSLLFPVSAWAQNALNAEQTQEISDWMKSKMTKRAESRMDALRRGESAEAGIVRIYPLSEYPAPDAVKQSIARGIESQKRGIMTVDPDRIASTSSVLSSVSKVRRTDAELGHYLMSPSSNLSQTALAQAELVSTEPAGLRQDGLSSGLSRVYRLPGMGLIELSEDDYVAGKAQIMLVRESLNAEVNSTPAIAYAARSTDGRGKATLSWVTPRRSYSLVLLADNSDVLPQGQKLLMDIATHIIE